MDDASHGGSSLKLILKSAAQQRLAYSHYDIVNETIDKENTKKNCPQGEFQKTIVLDEAEEKKRSVELAHRLTHPEVQDRERTSACIISALPAKDCKADVLEKRHALAKLLVKISGNTKQIIKHFAAELHDNATVLVIFTEYEGDFMPLSAMITTRRFRVSLVPQFTSQILTGLSVIHEYSIIHKDIRCSNIFVQTSEKDGKIIYTLKIAHFEKSSFDSTKSSNGEYSIWPEGSSQFASPEMQQLTVNTDDQRTRIGSATDVFSFGCTVIEMVQRSPPRWIYYRDGQMMQHSFKGESKFTEFVSNLHSLSVHAAQPDTSAFGSQFNALAFVTACITRCPDKRPTCAQLQEHALITNWKCELC
ncbi:probable serine/threonine-protein kinase fnkE isoform X2 [Paramacrobiotus metropolitanus]|nr:probable serine/threonine-protein kinase fnkE isoform X2 [Paramacrobiotus metropolitanus]XP_055350973.1 probable serine/threonine-protein kinase fnkE isoform X2 [Paramacrobiotus metropolitanus]XP_055350974.1 probable serine/threonine-protein kinase fnkE isoform X2 [Paramacrobiotus metropolitanus]XP_055350975.1 probable serine/threonine-protein kinase fnkE isoform X2 [Paramacrobiotus metropolitanus]XP_055350977.1 probable serine/threonine-protein kinase fnkE isoform X2 [Paramacrobiotus metrop